MGMVDTLVPGVSTLTTLARYYSLYWALADVAGRRDWDTRTCQTVLRRSEVALALVSRGKTIAAHGADRVEAMVSRGQIDELAEIGRTSYSPRPWGFWSQYNGPSAVLGTVTVESGALRPGPRGCPPRRQGDVPAPAGAGTRPSSPPRRRRSPLWTGDGRERSRGPRAAP